MGDFTGILYSASTWVLPILLAITLHEAAHGYAARLFGDRTAERAGRVTLNPLKHIDTFGTIILPGLLFLLKAPFLFGYAKPVPVDFARLRPLRPGIVLVAFAGPGINLVLAFLGAVGLHLGDAIPGQTGLWLLEMFQKMILINALLAVFNMLPIPPLDGGRVVHGFLPSRLAYHYGKLEPYGIFIVIGGLFLMPFLLSYIGIHFSPASTLILMPTNMVANALLTLAGHG